MRLKGVPSLNISSACAIAGIQCVVTVTVTVVTSAYCRLVGVCILSIGYNRSGRHYLVFLVRHVGT